MKSANNLRITRIARQTKSGRERLISLLKQRPLLDRFQPVWEVLMQMLRRGSDGYDRPEYMPEYCYRILRVFRNTSLELIPSECDVIKGDLTQVPRTATIEEFKRCVEINWDALGSQAGVIASGLRFFAHNFKAVCQQEGLIDLEPAEEQEFFELLGSAAMWRRLGVDQSEVEAGPTEGETDLDRTEAEQRLQLAQIATEALNPILKAALPFGQEAMSASAAGYAKTVDGVLDESGSLRREPVRVGAYIFLLAIWPEIQALQRRRPPITLEDFCDWLEPFMRDGIIIGLDLDQLRNLCDDIKLSFRRRGRPRKRA